MATQDRNQNSGNRSTQQKTWPTPKAEIKIIAGEIKKTTKVFKVAFEIKILKAGKALDKTKVRIKKGIVFLKQLETNAFGEMLYTHEELLTEQAQNVSLRFILDGENAGTEKEVTITLPALQPTSSEEKSEETVTPPDSKKNDVVAEDPENLDLSAYHNGDGKYTLHVRVTKTNGIGITTPVSIYVDGMETKLTTDKFGNATHTMDQAVESGKICKIKAIVSGIRDVAELTLKKPKDCSTEVNSRMSWEWLLGKNNGRAVLFAAIAVALWIFCFLIGWGDPILNPPVTELTVQQKMYNETVSSINPSLIIKPEASEGNWQKYFWLFSFLWTVFVPIYGILSLREEIAGGFHDGVERIIEKLRKQSDTASDPKLEKLIAWSNAHARVKKHPEATVTVEKEDTTTETKEKPKSGGGHLTFWDVFKSDMYSQLIIDVLPAILKRIFSK